MAYVVRAINVDGVTGTFRAEKNTRREALELAKALREEGLLVIALRPMDHPASARRPASVIVPRTPPAGREPLSSRQRSHAASRRPVQELGMRSIQYSAGWLSIDSAPLDEDVALLVTDGPSEPYPLKLPCRLTATGWVERNAVGGGAGEVEAVHSSPTSRKRR
jgi:hypothetical protein